MADAGHQLMLCVSQPEFLTLESCWVVVMINPDAGMLVDYTHHHVLCHSSVSAN